MTGLIVRRLGTGFVGESMSAAAVTTHWNRMEVRNLMLLGSSYVGPAVL